MHSIIVFIVLQILNLTLCNEQCQNKDDTSESECKIKSASKAYKGRIDESYGDIRAERVESVSGHYEGMLDALDIDINTDSMRRTPTRAAKAMMTFTEGYNMSLSDITKEAIFHESSDGIVVVKDIQMFSMCEHHLLPFLGKVTIGYKPNSKILGLSKFARVVEMFSRRLQVQERLTRQIAEAIYEVLNPSGVGVIIEATHLCMVMRGVQQYNSQTRTTYMLGSFKDDVDVKQEFLNS